MSMTGLVLSSFSSVSHAHTPVCQTVCLSNRTALGDCYQCFVAFLQVGTTSVRMGSTASAAPAMANIGQVIQSAEDQPYLVTNLQAAALHKGMRSGIPLIHDGVKVVGQGASLGLREGGLCSSVFQRSISWVL